MFDVDQAVVLRVKNRLLAGAGAIEMNVKERQEGAARARIVSVEADLRQSGWEGELFEAGFDPALPSAWILEGLTMYLDEQEVVDLIRILGNLCAPGSALCATCVSMESVARGKEGKSQVMNAWKWGCDDPQAFFESHFPRGWSFERVTLGTTGEFPTGADYNVGFKGKPTAYVLGYSSREGPP